MHNPVILTTIDKKQYSYYGGIIERIDNFTGEDYTTYLWGFPVKQIQPSSKDIEFQKFQIETRNSIINYFN